MDIGKIQPAEITSEMKKSYLDYAMSVIVARALPDVRDGLKPVHRRILYGMKELNLTSRSAYKKSARIVGEVLGKYHPHGDMAVYDSLVRMAQNFSMRYPLVDGQGNFGSVDGDSPAAMRYCVSGETRIVTDKGVERIKTLKKRNPHIKVLSFNDRVNNATKWFDSGRHPTKTIETHRGFSLCGSLNHPILVWKKSIKGKPGLCWKLFQDLAPGDFAVIHRNSFFFPEDPTLKEYRPEVQNKRTKRHQLPKKMNKDLAFLLGALVAEGSVGKKQIGFCNTDLEFLEKFKSCFKKCFPTCRLHEFKRKPQGFSKKSYISLEIHSLYVIQFLKNLGLNPGRAKTKRVPEIIFLSSKNSLASFLQSYGQGDGTVYLSGAPEVCFISTSKNLMADLQLLLLRFGIESSFRFQKTKNTYKLFIRGHGNLILFEKEINFVNHKNRAKLLKLSKKNKNGWVMSKTDYIPFIAEYLRHDREKNWGHLNWLKKHNLDRYPKLKKHWTDLKKILTPTDRLLLETLVKRKYLFDKIVKVSDSGVKRVYSLKVDSRCHSFLSNGFISHNTEARLAKITDELLSDLEKETVAFQDNFDGSYLEPVVLPAKLPNLLLMGAEGIAVGMATKIPPHNLVEVCQAIQAVMEKGEIENQEKPDPKNIENLPAGKICGVFSSAVQLEELMTLIKGPDFPTGAQIFNQRGLKDVYQTGRGQFTIRAKAEIQETKTGYRILISELPYQVNKANLISRIADLVKKKQIEGVTNIRDESDRHGLQVVILLKKHSRPKAVLNNLYKHTSLQTSFPANMVALVNGTPELLDLKSILLEYVRHRLIVVTKRSQFELKSAKKRAHILEGLKIALDNLDAVIKTIRKAKDSDTARKELMKNFGLSQIQAEAILEMKLRQLSRLERQKIEDEYKMLQELINYLVNLLTSPQKILKVISLELKELAKKYPEGRRTKIFKQAVKDFSEEDLVPQKQVIVTLTRSGYVKCLDSGTYRAQRRGGKGVSGMTTKELDEIKETLVASNHDYLYFFTDKGRVFKTKTYEIPETTRQAKGQAVINLINIEPEEKIQSVLAIPQEQEEKGFLFLATKKGRVKKTEIKKFKNIKSNGLIAINLNPDDEVINVENTDGDCQVFLVSHDGKSIRFSEKDSRPMGRDTQGVRGIALKKDDFLVSMDVFPTKPLEAKEPRRKIFRDILIVTANGLGKRTPLANYPLQKRGGVGVKVARITKKTGKVSASCLVNQEIEQVIITSKKAQVIKLPLRNIKRLHRNTQGVILMRFAKKGDEVASLSIL